ncbi:MAG: helix-turn-helix domain-containing protein [Chloroflexi bacterium]|nr:helix-turn-helix domain-containing protein [Chloroflexota bacterium]
MTFSRRLREILKKKNFTQRELARRLRVSESGVANWMNGTMPSVSRLVEICSFLDVSSDYLLGMDEHGCIERHEHGEFGWTTNIPEQLTEELSDEYLQGIQFFEAVVRDGLRESELTGPYGRFKGQTIAGLERSFRTAVFANALKLNRIGRNWRLEDDLLKLYSPSLKQVIVVELPKGRGSNKSCVSSHLLNIEFLAFAAATEVFPTLEEGAIGIGPGYTLYRCAELVPPSQHQYKSINWSSTMEVNNHQQEAASVSSNLAVKLLAEHNPNTRAFYLPYLPPEERNLYGDDLSAHQTQAAAAIEELRVARAILMTVGGVSSSNNHDLHGHAKRRTFGPKFLHSLHEQLKLDRKAASFRGEVLGYMLGSNAQAIGDASFQSIQERKVYAPALNLLRDVIERNNGFVWVIATGDHKKTATEMVVRNGLANALVIDEEIADFLIDAKRARRGLASSR